MPVELQTKQGGKVIHVHASQKLERDDYEQLSPYVEGQIQHHGKIRVLLVLHDFHGWKAGALWEDIKFDVKHFNDIERLAIVGENKWQEGMSKFCQPFTTAEIRFFPPEKEAEARAWVEQGLTAA